MVWCRRATPQEDFLWTAQALRQQLSLPLYLFLSLNLYIFLSQPLHLSPWMYLCTSGVVQAGHAPGGLPLDCSGIKAAAFSTPLSLPLSIPLHLPFSTPLSLPSTSVPVVWCGRATPQEDFLWTAQAFRQQLSLPLSLTLYLFLSQPLYLSLDVPLYQWSGAV